MSDAARVHSGDPRVVENASELPAFSINVDAAKSALFLDLDGTLAEFAPHPTAVGPDPERSDLLRRLADMLEGRIAIVSGRTIEDIDRILDGAMPNVAGVHGLERRAADGVLTVTKPHPALPGAVDLLSDVMRSYPGVLLEVKPLGVALHYRGDPDAGAITRQIATDYAMATGLSIQHGNMVVELLTPGRDKGAAVKDFMAEAPFTGAVPFFIGDDLTDEAAFRVVGAYGGVGVIVGARTETAATARLENVSHVIGWLTDCLDQRRFRLESAL